MTLVEMLVTVGVFLVAGLFSLTFLNQQLEFLDVATLQGDLRSRSQLAVDAIARDLRHATRAAAASPPNTTIPAAPANTALTLYLPADLDADGRIVDVWGNIEWDVANPVLYQYDAGTQQLQRVSAGATRVLAHHVTSATFEDRTMDPALSLDEVRVRFTLQQATPRGRTLSMTNSAVVRLRN